MLQRSIKILRDVAVYPNCNMNRYISVFPTQIEDYIKIMCMKITFSSIIMLATLLSCLVFNKDVRYQDITEKTVHYRVLRTVRKVIVTLWREPVRAVFRVTRDQHAMNLRDVLKSI